jgi:hypothetical protein
MIGEYPSNGARALFGISSGIPVISPRRTDLGLQGCSIKKWCLEMQGDVGFNRSSNLAKHCY